jgi:stage III sporulation protein AH
MNMIFNKRQLILAGLVVALGLAIYLNWQFASQDKTLEVTNTIESGTSSKILGDAKFVDNQSDKSVSEKTAGKTSSYSVSGTSSKASGTATTASGSTGRDYFTKARLDRQKTRDTALQTMQAVIAGATTDTSVKEKTVAEVAQIAKNIEAEGRIESLVKAKGFEDCVAFINGSNASIVVKTNGLQPNDAVKIQDIVVSEGKISAENIKIVEVK